MLALILIGHLWQVLDVDMYVADGVVLEALVLGLGIVGTSHFSEVADAVSSQASVESGSRHLRA